MSSSAGSALTARVRRHGEKAVWTCPECSRILGELTENRLVVVVRKNQHISFRLAEGMEMTCPYCHTVSLYVAKERMSQ